MDFQLVTTDAGELKMTYNMSIGTSNNILLSLNTIKGAFFLLPEFGSELHKIKTTSNQGVQLSKQYAVNAIKWMLDSELIYGVDVSSAKMTSGIQLEINYIEKGNKYNVTYYLRVS